MHFGYDTNRDAYLRRLSPRRKVFRGRSSAGNCCSAWSQSTLGAAGVLGQEPNQLAHDEQGARTRRTEKERPRKSMKSDSNLHGSLPNFAQRFAMKIKSYS